MRRHELFRLNLCKIELNKYIFLNIVVCLRF
jgi:hypothetical protein